MLSWIAFVALTTGGQKVHRAPKSPQKRPTQAKPAPAAAFVNDAFDLEGNPFGLGLSRDELFTALGKKEPTSAADRYWMFTDEQRNSAYYVFDANLRTVAFYWETRNVLTEADGTYAYQNPAFVGDRRLLPTKPGRSLLVGLNVEDILDWWSRFDPVSSKETVSPAEFPPYNRLRAVIALRPKPEYPDPLNPGKKARFDQPYILLLEGFLPGANWFVSQHTFDPSKGAAADWARMRTPQEQRDSDKNTFGFAVFRMVALPVSAYRQFAAANAKDPDIVWPNLSISGNIRALSRPTGLTMAYTSTDGGHIASWHGNAPDHILVRGG